VSTGTSACAGSAESPAFGHAQQLHERIDIEQALQRRLVLLQQRIGSAVCIDDDDVERRRRRRASVDGLCLHELQRRLQCRRVMDVHAEHAQQLDAAPATRLATAHQHDAEAAQLVHLVSR